jgi:hypothetical protein
MLSRGWISLGVTLGVAVGAAAQPAPPPTPPGPRPATPGKTVTPESDAPAGEVDAGTAPEAPAVEKVLTGDIITLKNGRVLSGVQVLRETANRVEVQVLEGDAPLAILKKQIENIERDDVEPGKPKREKPAPVAEAENEDIIINASKIPSELNEKLMQPLPDLILTMLPGQDYVMVLADISAQTGVPIEIAPELAALPAEQRIWSSTPASGTTLFTLLLDDLRKSFPDIVVAYEESGLIIRARAAVATPPAGGEAVGEAPVLPPLPGNPGLGLSPAIS